CSSGATRACRPSTTSSWAARSWKRSSSAPPRATSRTARCPSPCRPTPAGPTATTTAPRPINRRETSHHFPPAWETDNARRPGLNAILPSSRATPPAQVLANKRFPMRYWHTVSHPLEYAGVLASHEGLGLGVARDLDRYWLIGADHAVDDAREDRADQRRQPEQPELLERPAAREQRGSRAARRVHRGVRHRDAD